MLLLPIDAGDKEKGCCGCGDAVCRSSSMLPPIPLQRREYSIASERGKRGKGRGRESEMGKGGRRKGDCFFFHYNIACAANVPSMSRAFDQPRQ